MKCKGISAPLTAVLFATCMLAISFIVAASYVQFSSISLKSCLLINAIEVLYTSITSHSNAILYSKCMVTIVVPQGVIVKVNSEENSIAWTGYACLHIPSYRTYLKSINTTCIVFNSSKIKLLNTITLGPGIHKLVVEHISYNLSLPILVKIKSIYTP